ncbi:unnamed protein product [Oikopleura dioica]|uniref:Ion transport domain-containing protein n=1 Tax=Oikopleura dioica TaxID=34765 RepID=E4WTY6_OIKDI|nr:unnamed protein product [Oikopleura dioica]
MGDTDDIFSQLKKKENKINKREVYRQYTLGGSVKRQMSLRELGRSETIDIGYEHVSRESRRKKIVYRYYQFWVLKSKYDIFFYIFLPKIQQLIHNFLDRPSEGTLGRFSTLYHFMSFILVVACLCLTVFSTMEEHSELEKILNGLENMMIAQFFIEYILRVWSSGSRTRYRGTRGRLRYCCRIFSLLDLVVIIVGFSMIFVSRNDDSSRSLSATSTLRSVRFLQIARVFRLDRCGTSWKLLRSVFINHAKELLSAIYLGSLTLVFSSFMIFRIENGNGTDPFGTFGDALWWGVSTFSTIGYGDKVPTTGMGKFISSVFSIIGICFFALPAGILGTGFALKVQEQHRVKHNVKRRIPAARLIQTLWKIHVAEQEMLRRFQRSKF